ncbi:MAG: class F sortase [Pseudonocardia sp.]
MSRRVHGGGWLLAVAVLLAGCGSTTDLVPPAAPPAAATVAPSIPQVPLRPATSLPASEPVGLVVDAIGLRSGPLMDLGIDDGGALQVPPDATTVGWFDLSPAPGTIGPAVLAAHVDHKGVPGAFHRLAELAPGDEVTVRRADGSEAVFETYQVERHPKASFPTDQVYGDTKDAELRLITCGGVFDRGTGQYQDNVVAYARLLGSR